MNRLLFIVLFAFSAVTVQAQVGYLFVKKGYKKKKTYGEGDRISLLAKDGKVYNGLITLLRNDTIFINGTPMPAAGVEAVLLNPKRKAFHVSTKDLLLIAGGAGLTTAGLTLSNQAGFREALTAALVIGYGPLLIKYIGSKISLKRKKYTIGKKFRLQVLDFHMPRVRGF
jgi:hypothetical protein